MALKILIFSDYPPPNGVISGGIPRVVHSLVYELCKLDKSIEFHVCTLSSDVKKDIIDRIDNMFIHYIRFPLAKYPIIVPSLLTEKLVKREILTIKPDIIHVHGIGKDCAYPVIKQKFDPAIITVHGIIHEEAKTWNGILGRYRAIMGRRLESYILKNAKHLVAVSPYVKNTIEPVNKGDISVIFNPVDEKFFSVKKEEIFNRILFVGGIEPRKGLHVLIDAIKIVKQDIPDIRLHVVGSIRKKDYFTKIYEKVKEYNLLENVIFKGSVAEEKLIKEYSKAAIFILPSKEESLGVVLLEAMATETPIIASNVGGIPYIIIDGSNGYLVRFGDYKKLAEYIKILLSDDKLRKIMGLMGKTIARQYLPKEVAAQHLRLYKSLLF